MVTIDLDTIEREAAAFASAKAKATEGPWYRGACFVARCRKHADGRHLGLDHPTDPCVISEEWTTQGNYSSYVSTSDVTLIGSDDEGPILSDADAEFIVLARNVNLDSYVLALVAEVRRLRAMVEIEEKASRHVVCLRGVGHAG